MLRRMLRVVWWTGAALIVALAVLLSAARLMLPGMSQYRGQIEAVVGAVFNRPVSIGSLDAAWRGLSPVLKFGDVVVSDPELPDGRLNIDEVEVAVDLAGSVLQRKLLTSGVRLTGADLQLNTDLRRPSGNQSMRRLLDWLLGQNSVALADVQLHWRDPGLFATPLRLSGLSAKLVNAGQRHQFVAEAALPVSQGDTLKIAADLYGRAEDLAAWRGTFYIKAHAAQLSVLQPVVTDSGLLAGGELDLELWLGLARGRTQWGSGELAWRDFSLRTASADAQRVVADGVSGRFHWRRQYDHWRVGVEDFEIRRNAQPSWPASRFDLRVDDQDGVHVRAAASLLVLQELTGMLPLLPWVDNNALAILDRLRPRGLLRDAEFSIDYRSGDAPRFALRSAIENLTLAANGGLPGVAGVSGKIAGNLQAGSLRLDSSSAELLMPRVFSTPLSLSAVGGEVHWQRYQDRLRLNTQNLRLAAGPLRLVSRWLLDWPYDGAAPWLDLQLAAEPLALAQVRNYLPSGIMSDKMTAWLQQALAGGTATHTRMLVQGRLDQMPFDGGRGRFEARFDFDDAHLHYYTGWRGLDAMSGKALFSGRAMHIEATAATINGAPVERATADIKDLRQPILKVQGTVAGTLASMLDFVRHSPLQKGFGKLIDNTASSGDARLQLHLHVPLKHRLGAVEVQGKLLLEGNDLQPREGEIGLSDIRGTLYFTRNDVSLMHAKARVFDQPVALSVYKQGKGARSSTVVNVQGRLKLVDRARQKFPALGDLLQGNTGWQALLEIRDHEQANKPRVTVELHSGLQGVAIGLPPPFYKAATETRSLTISWAPGQESRQPLQIRYGEQASASVLLSPALRLRKAALHFGDTPAVLPEHNGVQISGHVAEIDLGMWLRNLPSFEGAGKGAALTSSVDLRSDVLRFGGLEVNDIHILSKAADPWYFELQGVGAQGWLRWIRGGLDRAPQLLARLDHLRLAGSVAPGGRQSGTGGLELKPATMPKLNVEVKDLRWGARELGALSVISRRVGGGMQFDTLKMKSAAITLDGTGDWLLHNGAAFSRFQARISAGSLERLSRLLGGGNSIKGGKLTGEFQLGWPGSPADFSLAKMEGEFDLQARDGRLENVEEGAGKLLSLLSLNSLQRRLNLDFSDVVKEGLSYNVMKGHFVVMDGDAFTNDFTLEGTSVDVEVAGRTGLVKHDYNQLITVTPQVSSTLPIAGAIAGGPLVGAAALLAERLLGDKFNRLTQAQYRVTGSWDKPVYTKLKKDHADDASEDGGSPR